MLFKNNIFKVTIIFIFIFILNIVFSIASELRVFPSYDIIPCQSGYALDIILNASGNRVVASDIKFFLEGFDFVSSHNLGGFDNIFYVGTGISTKGSDIGKTYFYINAYQNSFGNYITGDNINVVRLELNIKTGYDLGSLSFYNLSSNDEDSNISIGLEYGLNDMPLNYGDFLLNSTNGQYVFLACSGSIISGGSEGLGSSGGGGGGGSTLVKDDCPDGDRSLSYYDDTCEGGYHGSADICGVNDSDYSDELKGAYLYSYKYGITTKCPIWEADLDGYLYRNHFAKMISEFAINILGDNPNIGKEGCDQFIDIKYDTDEMKQFMKTACELNLMGMSPDGITPMDQFNPNSIVTRAEFGTVFSRLLFGDKYNVKDTDIVDYNDNGYWYRDHLNALKKYGIMTKIDGDWPKYNERRGWVMLMMQRADNYGLFFGRIPALMGVKALFE